MRPPDVHAGPGRPAAAVPTGPSGLGRTAPSGPKSVRGHGKETAAATAWSSHRRTARKVSQNGTTKTSYTYNPDGTAASRTDGTFGTISLAAYDWAKRPTSASASAGFSGSVDDTYNLDGTLASKTLGNGEIETIAYDPAKRPTTITLSNGNTMSETYDRAANVVTEARTLTGPTGNAGSIVQCFSYDRLSRRYLYAGGNPSTNIDPDGHRYCGPDGRPCGYAAADQYPGPQIDAIGHAQGRAFYRYYIPGHRKVAGGSSRPATDPRGVPPSVIEAEIANPDSTGVTVITGPDGRVITVVPR